MAVQLQLRRGTTAENNGFTGAPGELTVDTTTNLLRVHDGATVGGIIVGVADNSVGALQLNVSGNGTPGEALLSNGDGSFSFGPAGATISDDTATDSSFYPTLSDSTTGSFTSANVSSTKLFFNPSSGTLNATTFNSLSDEREKKNIKTLDSALDKTLSLRGVSFTYNDTDIDSIGVIAQEVEEVIPEVVSTGSDDLKSVSYGNIVGLLIEAIKEQQNQINVLKDQTESK